MSPPRRGPARGIVAACLHSRRGAEPEPVLGRPPRSRSAQRQRRPGSDVPQRRRCHLRIPRWGLGVSWLRPVPEGPRSGAELRPHPRRRRSPGPGSRRPAPSRGFGVSALKRRFCAVAAAEARCKPRSTSPSFICTKKTPNTQRSPNPGSALAAACDALSGRAAAFAPSSLEVDLSLERFVLRLATSVFELQLVLAGAGALRLGETAKHPRVWCGGEKFNPSSDVTNRAVS